MGVFCQILVNNPRRRKHEAGSPVKGVVRYTVNEPGRYKDIILSLIGKGKCEWTEQIGKHNMSYSGKEVYTEQHLSIHEKGPDGIFILPIGTYERGFTFILPPNIPSSFKNSTCTIAYKLVLKFERPSFLSIHKKFATEIDVIGKVCPIAPEGINVTELDKTLFKPFRKRTHRIQLQTELPNTIFRPGENVKLNYKVVNDTDEVIPAIKAELMCHTTYRASCGNKKTSLKTIKEITAETPSVPDNAVAHLASSLKLRDVLSTIQHSGIMWNEYRIKVTLKLPMPYINASTTIPIMIGEKYGANYEQEIEHSEEIEEEPPSYFKAMNECDDKEKD